MENMNEDLTIDLREIFVILKKRIFLIITITLFATLISAILSFFVITPIYEASTELLVNKTETEAGSFYSANDIQTNLKLIETYNVIIKSPRIIDLVIQNNSLDLTAEELIKKVTVSAVKDSQVISIKVTDPSQETAANLANAIATTFKSEIMNIMKVDNVQVLTSAKIQENPTPIKPQPYLNIAIAFVVGMMLAIGIVFLMEYLDNTIKTEQQVENILGYPVIGAITKMDNSKGKKHQKKREKSMANLRGNTYEA